MQMDDITFDGVNIPHRFQISRKTYRTIFANRKIRSPDGIKERKTDDRRNE